MDAARRQAIFERLRAANPAPTTELEYQGEFQLLIAVMLSAQTTDIAVNRVTRGLFAAAPTPRAMLALGVDGVRQHIRSIGLFNTKAANAIACCQRLLSEHDGKVPRDRQALEALPGVGRKTANVVLNTAFGEPTLAVDTHVFRVANRTGLAVGSTPLAVERGLLSTIPREFLRDAHHWLILHGRYTCTARRPGCGRCLIRDLCEHPPN